MAEKKKSYTEAVNELEAIIGKMQSEDCDIDNLTTYTTQALKLLKICKERLLKTDEEIKKCLEEME